MKNDSTPINFEEIIDALDDSVVIADSKGRFIYVNPNHRKNTGIAPEDILGRTIYEIIEDGNIFTGGVVAEVLETHKKAFKLATVLVTGTPQVGYVTGVPIFNEDGSIKYVVATSRPLHSLRDLKDDYNKFLDEISNINKDSINVSPHNDSRSLVGTNTGLKSILPIITKIAPTDATVLITGESGVGKEVVADEIYKQSLRKDNAFVKINCASIPETLLESELFGYEKGAFSGANVKGKKGLFEVANTGTILLDEIGDMPLNLQVKLLRAIQNKSITRVGGTKPIPLDIRIIASTNSDLKEKVSKGTFRQDLYYRLSVIPINIPPLRDRKSDIIPFCNNFIDFFEKKHGKRLILTDHQYNTLANYKWPGNVRELENVIEYLTICGSLSLPETNDILLQGILGAQELSDAANISEEESNIEDASQSIDFTDSNLKESAKNQEKAMIIEALNHTSSLREAGKLLGVNASTVSRKIKKYGINYNKGKSNLAQ